MLCIILINTVTMAMQAIKSINSKYCKQKLRKKKRFHYRKKKLLLIIYSYIKKIIKI